jgi:hypothetical protein
VVTFAKQAAPVYRHSELASRFEEIGLKPGTVYPISWELPDFGDGEIGYEKLGMRTQFG